MYILVTDGNDRLTLRRLRSWHGLVTRLQAHGLDSELARGDDPESCEYLAARAQQLTSARHRHDLALSLRRLLTGSNPMASMRLMRGDHIARATAELAELAARLEAPGTVPARGVAMVSQLLTEGTGPLYSDQGPDALRDAARLAASELKLKPVD
jgi:hypothetical protein